MQLFIQRPSLRQFTVSVANPSTNFSSIFGDLCLQKISRIPIAQTVKVQDSSSPDFRKSVLCDVGILEKFLRHKSPKMLEKFVDGPAIDIVNCHKEGR